MMERIRKNLVGPMLTSLLAALLAQHASSRVAAEELPEWIFLDGFEAAPVDANLVINEVDYVQPGIDDGEFIELYNPGPDALSLAGMTLKLIDGADDTPYAEILLDPVMVSAGAFFVVCHDPARVPNCDQQVSLTVPWIQDGVPDGVALSGPSGVIDALSYGGTLGDPWSEGTGTSAVDAGRFEGLSLGRFPDGADSDDNDADFRQACITPGAANDPDSAECPTFTVSGTVSGLEGSGLTLQIDREQVYNLSITADGGFQFAKKIENGSDYEVRVFLQPTEPNQTCSVTRGVGFIAGADITDVAVVCVNDGTDFSVGGSVSGLVPGSIISLFNNSTFEQLVVFFNGPFSFAQKQANGTEYDVQAVNVPSSPVTCSVTNGVGVIVGADVTDIEVACVPTTYSVGGTVNALVGSGLVLQNNGADDLPINGNGSFTFAGELEQGEAYAVTVKTQPSGPSQTCFVSGGGDTEGGGIITENNITTIQVTCAIDNPQPGALVITEVMADPLGTDNEESEWFEVRNLSSDYLFLNDCTLSNDAAHHLITAEAPIAPNETVVFVRDQAQAVGDRISPYFLYADINLDNTADSLTISCDSTVVDAMSYSGFTEGAARQLDADTLDPAANDDLANWCDATVALPSGNLGTPGNINRSCP
jgi:hypothetical protein